MFAQCVICTIMTRTRAGGLAGGWGVDDNYILIKYN